MKSVIVPFHKKYDRTSFSCGKESLDHYIQKQVSQDIRKKLTTCFLLPDEKGKVIGYYTLSTGGIPANHIPTKVKKTLPKGYHQLPIILLGRLALDKNHLGRGLGSFLLIDALIRCWTLAKTELGCHSVVVDPLDSEAESFYSKFGFVGLPDSGRMMLPIKTIGKLLGSGV